MAASYQRILLKLSGELLAGEAGHGIDEQVLHDARRRDPRRARISASRSASCTGGGNIFRGLAASTRGMDRVGADYMGMLATVINALALQHALEKRGLYTRVMSAIEMERVCEPYIRRRAVRHLEKGRIVVLAAGTGNPVLHHRHRGGAARDRSRRRRDPQGHQGGRRLQRRPEDATRRRRSSRDHATSIS